MEILLVEDSATLRANMASLLGEMGHVVHHAESGEQCLHLIEGCQDNLLYDLVLMDVELPGLDGFETTRLVREILYTQWIPIIFVTAVTDEASYEKGIEAGGDDYLPKPVSRIVLQAKIRAMERIAQMQHKLARLNKALKSVSERDTLTSLLNRRTFTQRTEQYWDKNRRRSSTSGALIMLDVDFFKQYNDTYGHLEGDRCLRRVASVIRAMMDDAGHLTARYGGEEFIIFIQECDQRRAFSTVERIRKAIYAIHIEHLTSKAKRITISAGVAVTNNLASHSLDKLIAAADKQLYRAKKSGRNNSQLTELDSSKTILIGVSHTDEQVFLSQILANQGNIVTAENGPECVDIAKYIIPDIVILGSDIKGKSGECACSELKQHQPTANIPVILLREGTTLPRCRHKGLGECAISLRDKAGITKIVAQLLD